MREWQYWTRNKLSILAGYLPAFNVASSKRSPERLYIDLMAGEPFNRDKETGEEFDGSARLALSCAPPFTRIALCEIPQKAAALEKDLRTRYPGRSFRVYPGDLDFRELSGEGRCIFPGQPEDGEFL
jgi:three-Cys-motif partner protein